MDNIKIITYKTLYSSKAPAYWDVEDEYIKIRDNEVVHWENCNHNEPTLGDVFNGAQLSNFRENKTGHKPNNSDDCYDRLIDIKLSNCIDPSTISFDADDEYHIWRESKKLKFCHMFSEKLDGKCIETFPPLTDKMLSKDEYGVYASKEELKLSVDKTERTLFGKIKCNIVVTDYNCHLGCNKAGLPECVKVLSDKIADIQVNKQRLLEIDDGETFRFFADKNARYDGVEIDTDKPITCRYQNGEIKVANFVDKQGKEHKPQESKENEQKTKQAHKDTACGTINEIIRMLPLYKNSKYKQEDIATQNYTWLNNLTSAINNEQTNFTINDLMNVNNYLNVISSSLKELLNAETLLQKRVEFLNANVANNLNNLKKMFEEKNICKTKLEEPKPVVHNDNNNNNDNMRIILEGKTIKNSNNENLKTLLGPNRDDLKKTIEDYVNGNTNATEQQDVAKTIALLINKDGANFLEKYSRTFAFSHKDKRAQQVYETYKNIEKNLNIITNDDAPEPQYKMYELGNVHSINTPCGWGCL